MSTLTALQQQRDLHFVRLEAMASTERPRLLCRWAVDSTTGRPLLVWTAVSPSVPPAASASPQPG